MSNAELNRLRTEIDALDDEIQRLFAARAEVALCIGAAKRAQGESVHRPDREAQILDRIRANNAGPLSDEVLVDLFDRLIVACRTLQDQ